MSTPSEAAMQASYINFAFWSSYLKQHPDFLEHKGYNRSWDEIQNENKLRDAVTIHNAKDIERQFAPAIEVLKYYAEHELSVGDMLKPGEMKATDALKQLGIPLKENEASSL